MMNIQKIRKNVTKKVFQLFGIHVEPKKPFSLKIMLVFSVIVIILLSLLAGYYHAQLQAEQKKYLRLEDRYVRVREQLGRQATQDLIDASYK